MAELVGTQPKRLVRKLTEEEKIRRDAYHNHSIKYDRVLENIRLRPYENDPNFWDDHWELIMTWLCGETHWKHSIYYGLHYEDFIFTCDNDKHCIQFHRDGITSTKFYLLNDETEMKTICDKNLLDMITHFHPSIIFENLKADARKQTAIPANTRPDNAPSYDSSNCPICFCEFVCVEEESDHIYNKATGKLPKDDERVVRVDTCCGHLICVDCFNNVRNRGNRKCPTCRADLDCWDEDSDSEYEDAEYTINDIGELIYDENEEELIRITDMAALRTQICDEEGYEGLSGYDSVCEFDRFYICEL
jgi:hypothetical protein